METRLGPGTVLTRGLGPVTDPALAWECACLLAYEARLLEERRFDEWLELYTDDCLHWVPTDPDRGADEQLAISYEDRRRLTDRVVWLKSAYLHAQSPPSRTVRQVSNVEAWELDGVRLVQSTLNLAELRDDRMRHWIARVEHHLVPVAGAWRIRRKTVLLLNCDKPVGNIAFAF
ncbi:aromatic-ring-hydroxylating dioxygenase subunit beta [Dactylosporangium sp. CA-092794]|uniref:aromatic-ring-hydroxylating dioxygenase subunit beta n=1 Tax=Dactylosporangium sp. CA-092794 TaxID=3239929 RepID=UPI003D89F887